MATQHLQSAESSQSLAPHPSSSSSSSLPSSTNTHIPPRLPPSLITTILTFILPYSGALPPDLLSKPFQQRLIFLPPGEDEMDKQLSPFPLPVGVNALMERLEALAREHALGKERYGWDGEAYVAKRELVPEHEMSHAPVAGEGQGLELHFMHEAERGWTFHGLRIPEHDQSSSSGMGSDSDTPSSGMVWSDDPSDVSVPLSHTSQSPHMDADNETAHVHAAIASAASGSSTGLFGSLGAEQTRHADVDNDEDEEEPENAYQAELKRQKEASAFWSAWSPESKDVELPTPGGSGMSDQQQEEDYWAQYSAGPSVAPSAAQSPALPQRRLSERPERSGFGEGSRKASYAGGAAGSLHSRPTVQSPEQQGGGRVFDAAGGAGSGYPFPSVSADASTSHPAGYSNSTDSPSQPQLQAPDAGPSISLNSAPPSPPVDTPAPAPARLSTGHHPAINGTVPVPASSSNDANLLRTRLTSKMTSLLRRAWNGYIAGVDRQDELEVRAMRWLTIGRAVCLGPGTPTAANMSFGGGAAAGVGNGWHAQSNAGGDEETDDDIKARMETMYELFDVSYDHDLDDDEHSHNDGHDRNNTRESRAGRAFYKLIEEAVRPANGTANAPGQQEEGQHGYGPMGAEGLERTYSTEQLSFWES